MAFRGGGARETIIDGKTGLFFFPQTATALKKALLNFDSLGYNESTCYQNALKYNEERFRKEWEGIIRKVQEM